MTAQKARGSGCHRIPATSVPEAHHLPAETVSRAGECHVARRHLEREKNTKVSEANITTHFLKNAGRLGVVCACRRMVGGGCFGTDFLP
jgi:hypothetical protein